jgi:hypothetical protein
MTAQTFRSREAILAFAEKNPSPGRLTAPALSPRGRGRRGGAEPGEGAFAAFPSRSWGTTFAPVSPLPVRPAFGIREARP